MYTRGAAKSLLSGAWTGAMTSLALGGHALNKEAGLVVRLTGPWAEGLARLWGMQVRAFGTSRLDPDRTYLFMANHESYADIIALLVALPAQPGFLPKKELGRVPFLGPAMKAAGHVFVDRSNRDRAVHAIEEAAQQIRTGRSVVVFPEGTRGDGIHLRPFKKGPFHLAKAAEVPVVPAGIRGSDRVIPKGSPVIYGGPVELHLGEPISPERVRASSLEELRHEVRQAVAEASALRLTDET